MRTSRPFAGKRLPLVDARAVGGPVPLPLLGGYFAFALGGWVAATVAAVAAAPDLAAGRPDASLPLLATHLVALGTLPFAVTGAAFHLLPVMLRNDLPSVRAGRLALGALTGAYLLAPGVAFDVGPLVWTGAGLVATGVVLVLGQLAALVVRAPSDRMLIVSRTGVALSAFHAAAALVLGAFIFSSGDRAVGGVSQPRWVLVHLHVALIGWFALLVVAVGRTLAPMLAGAPAAPQRGKPVEELLATGGLWLLAAGLASGSDAAVVIGGATVAVALGRFGALLARTGAARRLPLEAPLVHLAAGALFLVQAAAFGLAAIAGADVPRLTAAYVVLLLGGWAAGVVIAHVGKLLALSFWVWWPPGPRPRQATLYPRRVWLAEAGAFVVGLETLAVGVAAGSRVAATVGAAALVVAALLAVAGAGGTVLGARRGATSAT